MKRLIFVFVLLLLATPAYAKDLKLVIDGKSYEAKGTKYPAFTKNEVIYFPLTAENRQILGLKYGFKSGNFLIERSDEKIDRDFYYYDDDGAKSSLVKFDFNSKFLGFDFEEKRPLLKYKNMPYLPLSWRNVVDILGYRYEFKDGVLRIDTDEKNSTRDISLATKDAVYKKEFDRIFKEDKEGKKAIYKLPKWATEVELNYVDNSLLLRYNSGGARSQQRLIKFSEDLPLEIYSGAYRLIDVEDVKFLLNVDENSKNLYLYQYDNYKEICPSEIFFSARTNGFDNFTEDIATDGKNIVLLAGKNASLDRIVELNGDRVPKTLLTDPKIKGFTSYGDKIYYYTDNAIYKLLGNSKELLFKADPKRIFPSVEGLYYITQNSSFFRDSKDINPYSKVTEVYEQRDSGKIYTFINFEGEGFKTIVLCDGKIVFKSKKAFGRGVVESDELYFYDSLKQKTISYDIGE